jgi:hypothetical protein
VTEKTIRREKSAALRKEEDDLSDAAKQSLRKNDIMVPARQEKTCQRA